MPPRVMPPGAIISPAAKLEPDIVTRVPVGPFGGDIVSERGSMVNVVVPVSPLASVPETSRTPQVIFDGTVSVVTKSSNVPYGSSVCSTILVAGPQATPAIVMPFTGIEEPVVKS